MIKQLFSEISSIHRAIRHLINEVKLYYILQNYNTLIYGNILNNSEVLISNIDNSIPAVFSCSSLLSLFNKETPTSSKINKYDNTINLNETHEKKSDDDIIIK